MTATILSPLAVELATGELTGYQRSRAYYMADYAVTCPKCKVRFGHACESTGGGNSAMVPTHKARRDRTDGWSEEQRQQYGELVWRHYRQPWDAPADLVAEAEASAAPIPTKTAKQPTPRGIRLSERQAEEIEYAARDGWLYVSTVHHSGDAAHRQVVQALEAKGVLEYVDTIEHGYERRYRLTDFGWQVYRQHRLIIRREPIPAGATSPGSPTN